MKIYICNRKKDKFLQQNRRGARVVMEQIANLSTGNRRLGSNPCLSAFICFCGVKRSPVIAPALGAGGRRFESCHPDDNKIGCVAQLDRATHF